MERERGESERDKERGRMGWTDGGMREGGRERGEGETEREERDRKGWGEEGRMEGETERRSIEIHLKPAPERERK